MKYKGSFIKILVVIGLVILFILGNRKEDKIERIMKDSIYETSIHYINQKVRKPRVFIVAGIHGNEIAGIKAAELLLEEDLPINLGLLPLANSEAYRIEVRNPYYMADLNRNFPGRKVGTHTEQLAYEIFESIRKFKPDFVIDLHEWERVHDENSQILNHGFILNTMERKLWQVAEKVYNNYNQTNDDKISLDLQAPAGSLNREVWEKLSVPVITIESNMAYDLDERINFHINIVKELINTYETDD